MFGRDALTPTDFLLTENPDPVYVDISDYRAHMQNRLQRAWTLALRQVELSQEKAEKHNPAAPKMVKQDDVVRVHSPALKAGVAAKFHRPWDGSYRVLKVQDSNCLLPLIGSRKSPKLVLIDRWKLIDAPILPQITDKEDSDAPPATSVNNDPADLHEPALPIFKPETLP